jgi:hypothetical protein
MGLYHKELSPEEGATIMRDLQETRIQDFLIVWSAKDTGKYKFLHYHKLADEQVGRWEMCNKEDTIFKCVFCHTEVPKGIITLAIRNNSIKLKVKK